MQLKALNGTEVRGSAVFPLGPGYVLSVSNVFQQHPESGGSTAIFRVTTVGRVLVKEWGSNNLVTVRRAMAYYTRYLSRNHWDITHAIRFHRGI